MPAMQELRFTVVGHPEPGGSKRAFAIRRGGVPTGRIAVSDANPRAKSWQRLVAEAAMQAVHEQGWECVQQAPCEIELTFYRQRAKGHYGTGKNAEVLKRTAPSRPTQAPDAKKLARGTTDALKGIVWRDDSQAVRDVATKRYGIPERCEVTVRVLPVSAEDAEKAAL